VRPLPAGEPECLHISLTDLVVRTCFQTSGVVVRKSCLEAVGGFDTKMTGSCEDRDLWIRLGAQFDVRRLQVPLVFTHGEEHDHLSGKPAQTEEGTRKMLEKVFNEIPQLRGRHMLK